MIKHNTLLDGLNESQKKAVLFGTGRAIVLAGAGSGKTSVLTRRISYLLNEGVQPWNILTITFTSKAAHEMKDRAKKLNDKAQDMWMGTFHSICNRILNANLEKLGIDAFTILNESDQKSIIKAGLQFHNIADEDDTVRYMIHGISTLKSEAITPQEARSRKGNKKEEDSYITEELCSIYDFYEDSKKKSISYDFDDLLLKTLMLFRADKNVFDKYRNQFKYILVDESQDTNSIQFKLVEALSSRHKNVFLVGDLDQAIYAFRNAKLENLLDYKKLYPETEILYLVENYRSPQSIVEAANNLILNNKKRLEKEAVSQLGNGDEVSVLRFDNYTKEANFISSMINIIKREEKQDFQDFAILYRSGAKQRLNLIEFALREQSIPYELVNKTSLYDKKEIKSIYYHIRLVNNPHDDAALFNVLQDSKMGFGAKTLAALFDYATRRKVSGYTVLLNLEDYLSDHKLNKKNLSFIEKAMVCIDSLQKKAKESFLATSIVRQTIKEFGLLDGYDINDPTHATTFENISILLEFAKEWDIKAKDDNTLSAFIHDVGMEEEDGDEDKNKVKIMTIHGSKGLEWNNVFIIGMEDGVFPHYKSKDGDDLEEERRVAYVAITRAKRLLFLSYAHYHFGFSNQKPSIQTPSAFLGEIPDNFKMVFHEIKHKKDG